MSRFLRYSLLAAALGLTGCASLASYLIDSQKPEQQVIIDGQTDDWAGRLYIVENERVSLGLVNDRDNLYLCLLAEDDFTRAQIMMQGLTVWFDPQGGKKKTLGIKHPLGRPPGERRMPRPGDNPEKPEFETPPEELAAELEIIRPEHEEPQRMSIADAKGIELKAVPSSGLLVYELKIPLRLAEEHPIAVGAEPGKTIGLGFETGKLDPLDMPRQGPGGMPGGRGGLPPVGGRPGGVGIGGFGRGPGRLPGIRFWAEVKLDPGPGGSSPEPARISRILD